MNSTPDLSSLTQDEILNYMFEGEKNRDASSKIRGFIFQDLVALDYLLDESTDSVVLEFIEDVTVKYTDDSVLCIQAKYYPNSTVPTKEIIRDLYYQYLRLGLFSPQFQLSFQLAYHHTPELSQLSLSDIKECISPSDQAMPLSFHPANPHRWLSEQVYNRTKTVNGKERYFNKNEQENALFGLLSTESRIIDFYSLYCQKYFSDLTSYRNELAGRLVQLPQIAQILSESDITEIIDSEQVPQIVFGAALLRIQARYITSGTKISNLKIARSDFLVYLQNVLIADRNKQISAYLVALVNQKQVSIISNNPGISQDLLQFLSICTHKTSVWIDHLVQSKEGQIQLLNTLSRKKSQSIQELKSKSTSSIFRAIIACEDNIDLFLDYLWKIMYNICLENPPDNLQEFEEMADPCHYIVSTENRYICLRFNGKYVTDYVQNGAILPHIRRGKQIEDTETIWERMQGPRPQKWYLPGTIRGPRNYTINPARMNIKPSIVDRNLQDVFYVECMDCIKIDADTWMSPDHCSNCIFQKSCIKKNG